MSPILKQALFLSIGLTLVAGCPPTRGDDDDSAGDDDDDDDATGDDDDDSTPNPVTIDGTIEPCATGTGSYDSYTVTGPATVVVDTVAADTTFDTVLITLAAPGDYDSAPIYDPAVDDAQPCSFEPPNTYACSTISLPAGNHEIVIRAAVAYPPACADEAVGGYVLNDSSGTATLVQDNAMTPDGWPPLAG